MIIFILIAAVVFLLIKPFISAILASFVLAYLFHPFYKFVKKGVRNNTVASLIVSTIIVLLFTIPLVFIANSVSNEARINYVFIKKILATGDILEGECENGTFLCQVIGFFEDYIDNPQIKFQITNALNKATNFLIDQASNFIFSIPGFLINFFIMVFIIFYLFKDGGGVAFRIRELIPFSVERRKKIFKKLNDVTYAVVYGHLLTAAVQGAIGIIAFMIFGVSAPVLWGMVMFFFALIPFLGTPVVWVPAVIIKAIANEPLHALGILIFGIIISTIDNLIKPKLVSRRGPVHPVFVLLGVLGGLYLFGIIGVIIGPVILSLFMSLIEIYEEDKSETKS